MEPRGTGRHPGSVRRIPTASLLLLAFACAAPPPTRAPERTAAVMLEALDSEALFTVAGGLKPVSEGFWRSRIEIASPDLREIVEVRDALAPWRNEQLWADVHVFHQAHEGKRYAVAWVAHRRALRAVLARRADFFAPYGLGPDTHPTEVFAVVERMPTSDRHRGMGLLFGYPQRAIDFFVEADASKAEGQPLTPRRFVQIPTYKSDSGRFVYAVAADAVESDEDKTIAARAAARLRRWRELRAESTNPDAATVMDWSKQLLAEFEAEVQLPTAAAAAAR